jgi:hypothetical protein
MAKAVAKGSVLLDADRLLMATYRRGVSAVAFHGEKAGALEAPRRPASLTGSTRGLFGQASLAPAPSELRFVMLVGEAFTEISSSRQAAAHGGCR